MLRRLETTHETLSKTPSFVRISHVLVLGTIALGVAHCGATYHPANSKPINSTSFAKEDQIVQHFAKIQQGVDDTSAPHAIVAGAENGIPTAQLFKGAKSLNYDVEDRAAASNTGAMAFADSGNYSTKIDMRGYDTPIKNQGAKGVCTAFATIAAMENMAHHETNQSVVLSEEHLWHEYGSPYANLALEAGAAHFIVPENIWPYNSYPTETDYSIEGVAKITDYQALSSVSDILAAISNRTPVVIGLPSNYSLRDTTDGVVDPRAPLTGMGHAMEVVGRIDNDQVDGGGYFIVKNSWGPQWGDHGYGYLPYSYCKYNNCYGWAVKSVEVKGIAPTNQPTDSEPNGDTSATGVGTSLPIPSAPRTTRPDRPDSLPMVTVQYQSQGYGRMAFRLVLAGDVSQVREVTYNVHPSYGSAAIFRTSDAASQFATGWYVTGYRNWRTSGANVVMQDGSTVSLAGALVNW